MGDKPTNLRCRIQSPRIQTCLVQTHMQLFASVFLHDAATGTPKNHVHSPLSHQNRTRSLLLLRELPKHILHLVHWRRQHTRHRLIRRLVRRIGVAVRGHKVFGASEAHGQILRLRLLEHLLQGGKILVLFPLKCSSMLPHMLCNTGMNSPLWGSMSWNVYSCSLICFERLVPMTKPS